ncbi:MAG: hypothetical protein NXH75_07095 [Halobacteriovoraceae bacterium]|nr:hypothetical protein [Halobacteriovoraceae bacterium]
MKFTFLILFFSLSLGSINAQREPQFKIVSEENVIRSIVYFMDHDFEAIRKMVEVEGIDPNFSLHGYVNLLDNICDNNIMRDYFSYESLNFNNQKAKILDYLISKGLKVEYYSSESSTLSRVLFSCSGKFPYGDAKYVDFLLSRGSNVNNGYKSSITGRVNSAMDSFHSFVIVGKDLLDVMLKRKPDYRMRGACGRYFKGHTREINEREKKKAIQRGLTNFSVTSEVINKYLVEQYNSPDFFLDDGSWVRFWSPKCYIQ